MGKGKRLRRRRLPKPDRLVKLALAGVACVIAEDYEGWAAVAGEIAGLGSFAIHVVLTGLAEMATGLRENAEEGHFWGLQAEDTRSGDVISAGAVPAGSRGFVTAMQIAVAYGNGDHATVDALISAAGSDPETGSALMAAMFQLAAEQAKSMAGLTGEDGTDDGS